MKSSIVSVIMIILVTAFSFGFLLHGLCQQSVKAASGEENSWTIGFYTGSSPFHLSPAPGAGNPVFTAQKVTDLKVDIVAHPFMVVTNSFYYMFFTAKYGKTDMGGIGLAKSTFLLPFSGTIICGGCLPSALEMKPSGCFMPAI